jgi:hypothetical protein
MTRIFDIVVAGTSDDPELWDINARGYCTHVMVRTSERKCFRLDFYEPCRLAQDIDVQVTQMKDFLAEPEVVVIPDVNREEIVRAVTCLAKTDYFEKRVPTEWFEPSASDLVWGIDEFLSDDVQLT